MSEVRLRSMSEEEYVVWYPEAVAGYAQDHIRAGSMPADKAHESAAAQFAELLPDGLATESHHLLVGDSDGNPVGLLWLNIRTGAETGNAFVYDVEVHADQRGKGYGRGIMAAAEAYARDHGADTIKLHVFGDNTVARGLYDSLGYVATNINMAKKL